MYKCLECESVFDEDEIIETVIDYHPYGEGYAAEYGCTCPRCGSTEISEAFQCSRCDEYFPLEDECSPTDEPMCPDCADEAEDEIMEEDNPYKGITDMFGIASAMFKGA